MSKFKLWTKFVQLSLGEFSVYRVDLVLRLVSMIVMICILYFVLSLPYSYVGDLAGWNKHSALVLIGFYYVTNGLSWMFFRESIGRLEDDINKGNLDNLLMKPVSSEFMVSFFTVDVTRVADFFVGLVFVVVNFVAGGFGVDLLSVIGCVFSAVSGLSILRSMFLVINSLSFWTTETYLDHVANPIVSVAKFPVDIWGDRFRDVFYWVIPVAFVSAIPAAVLIGKMEWWWGLIGVGLAFGWNFLMRMVWRVGLKNYSGVGG